ncbi:MAG: hypothetical protein Q8916_04240 [Bacteroidota bacterium]|nr:hypothetical protein [Bacteroidota bacterium]MDP4236323.1 hypothetical protein [Bacteroidota bacterium]
MGSANRYKNTAGKILVTFILIAGFCSAPRGQWVQTNGPLYGYVHSFVACGDTLIAAAGFGGGIFTSIDHGINWSKIETPFDSLRTTTLLKHGTAIFAATINGTFRSTNNGKDWTYCSALGIPFFAMSQTAKYIFGEQSGWIYYSADNGNTWSRSDTTYPSGGYSLYANDTVILAGNEKGIFRTTDFGHSWSQPDTLTRNKSITVIRSIGDTLYCGGTDGLYRSTNAGRSWELADDSLRVTDIIRFGNILIVSTYDGIFRSFDNGLHWVKSDSGLNDLNIQSIIANSGYLFAGTYTDWLYRSADSGRSWVRMKGGIANVALNLTQSGNAIFAGSDKGVYRTTDDGISWIPKNVGIGDDFTSGFVTFDSLLVRTGNYVLARSTDNGELWITQPGSQSTGLWIFGNTIISSDAEHLERSTDLGLSWKVCLLDSSELYSVNVTALATIGSMLFASGPYLDGILLRSADGGGNWISVHPADTLDVTALVAVEDTLIAGTEDQGIFRSTDMGNHWSQAHAGANVLAVTSFARSGKYLFAGSSRSGVLYSSDNGANWREFNESLGSESVQCLLVSNGFLFAGTDSLVWKRPLSDLGVHATDNSAGCRIVTTAPNPFISETTISLSCIKTMTLHFEVFNLLGRKVFDGGNTIYNEGEHTITLQGGELPHGEFFGRFSASDGSVKSIKLQHF